MPRRTTAQLLANKEGDSIFPLNCKESFCEIHYDDTSTSKSTTPLEQLKVQKTTVMDCIKADDMQTLSALMALTELDSINNQDESGKTSLMHVVENGFLESTCFLIRNGADVSLRCNDNKSAAAYAYYYQHLYCENPEKYKLYSYIIEAFSL